jgi:hypothetical protein
MKQVYKIINNPYFTSVLLIISIIFIFVYYFRYSEYFNLKCVISKENGNIYCVRDRKKLHQAVEILARTMDKCEKLVKYLKQNYPNDTSVERLYKNFDKSKVVETLPTSELKAYSENKGEKLAFCLNKNDSGSKLIDENTLMFVALHELSHLMTETIGHDQTFWTNFKFLIQNAVKINIYKPVDYKNNNENYCGLEITDNPYYDL